MHRMFCVAAIAAVLALPACTKTTDPNTHATTVTVNLANAQAEANAVAAAVSAAAFAQSAQLQAAAQENLKTALSSMNAAVSAFASMPATNPKIMEYAKAATQAIEAVIALVPLPPATKLAVDEGLALVDALVAGLTTVPATPAPAAASVRVGAKPKVYDAPIPIPAS